MAEDAVALVRRWASEGGRREKGFQINCAQQLSFSAFRRVSTALVAVFSAGCVADEAGAIVALYIVASEFEDIGLGGPT